MGLVQSCRSQSSSFLRQERFSGKSDRPRPRRSVLLRSRSRRRCACRAEEIFAAQFGEVEIPIGGDRRAQARRVLRELRGEGPDRIRIRRLGPSASRPRPQTPRTASLASAENGTIARLELISRVGYERIRRLHDVQDAVFVFAAGPARLPAGEPCASACRSGSRGRTPESAT